MYIGISTISMIIGIGLIMLLFIPIGIKAHFAGMFHNKKTKKDNILVRTVDQTEQERPNIVAMQGSATEVTKTGRAYIPQGKHEEAVIDDKGKRTVEFTGNTFWTWFPEGLPRVFQVRIRAMCTPENDPSGINFYGKNPRMETTSDQIALIQAEKFSKNAIAASDDSNERFEAMQKLFKGKINGTLVYIMLGIILIGVIAIAYFTFTSSGVEIPGVG